MTPLPLPRRQRSIRRAVRRHRRPLATLCTAGALWAGLQAVAPPPAATAPVAVAARDLAAGAALSASDVRVVALPPGAVPDGATAPSVGAVLAAPVRRGEPFTDVRLARGGPARPAGTVLVTVRTADPAAALAVRPGDRVDVLAGPSPEQVPGTVGADPDAPHKGTVEEATTIGTGLLVLAVPGRPGADPAGLVGARGAAGAAGAAGGDPAADDGAGLLGAVGPADPELGAPGVPAGLGGVDAAGVLVVAADRRAAARLAAAVGLRPLSVVVVSR